MGYKNYIDGGYIETDVMTQDSDEGNWVSYQVEVLVKTDTLPVHSDSTSNLLITNGFTQDSIVIDNVDFTVNDTNDILNIKNLTLDSSVEFNQDKLFISSGGRKGISFDNTKCYEYDIQVQNKLDTINLINNIDLNGSIYQMSDSGTFFIKCNPGTSLNKYYLTEAWNLDSLDDSVENITVPDFDYMSFSDTLYVYSKGSDLFIKGNSDFTLTDKIQITLDDTVTSITVNDEIIFVTVNGLTYQYESTDNFETVENVFTRSLTTTSYYNMTFADNNKLVIFKNGVNLESSIINYYKSVDISSLSLSNVPSVVYVKIQDDVLNAINIDNTVDSGVSNTTPTSFEYDTGNYVLQYPLVETDTRTYKARINLPKLIEITSANVKFVKED